MKFIKNFCLASLVLGLFIILAFLKPAKGGH